MLVIFLVACGGAAGAALRYALGLMIKTGVGDAFPWATLTINVLGSIFLGVLMRWTAGSANEEAWRALLGVGLAGGFTTFSTFGLETVTLAQGGAWQRAVWYVALSLAGGLLGMVVGLSLGGLRTRGL